MLLRQRQAMPNAWPIRTTPPSLSPQCRSDQSNPADQRWPIELSDLRVYLRSGDRAVGQSADDDDPAELRIRSEEHTSELQSRGHLVCRLLLVNKKFFYFYI